MRNLLLVMVILSALFISHAGAHAIEQNTPEWALSDSLPLYVRIITDPYDLAQRQLPDSTFNRIAGSTIFRVNRTKLNSRDPFLQELATKVLPYANSQGLALVGIELRGAASPEGPYWNNVRLSEGRAAALRKFITDRLDPVFANEFTQTTIAEDYPRLLWIMEQQRHPDTERVRAIINLCGLDNPAAIKAKLQKADGGRLWRDLLRDIFPVLRSARVVLFFQKLGPDKIDTGSFEVFADVEVPLVDIKQPVMEEPTFLRPVRKRWRHVLSVSTNLLYDGFYMPDYGWAPMPNVGLELYPGKSRWTLRAAFTFPYYHKWDQHKFFQIRDYHLEVRRYFRPGWWHTGCYLGMYANATKYGIGLDKERGWQGEGIGGALKLGYVFGLGKKSKPVRLDLHIAGGAWMTRYDPYVYGNPITGNEDGDYYYDYTGDFSKFKKRNKQLWWFGPTEVGLTISFDFIFRKTS